MKRLLSLLISGLLLLSAVPAYGALGVPSAGEAARAIPVPMDPFLVKEFEKGEQEVPIIVYMKDTLDRESLGRVALASGFDRYNTVVDGLKTSTFQSQQPLLQNLSDRVEQGSVKDLRSFYVANALTMTATSEVARELALRPDVEEVVFDRIIPLEDPVEVPSSREVRSSDPEVEWNIARIGADVLWDEGITGQGITVGIIDTGVDGLHPALARKWKGSGMADPSEYWLDAVEGKPFPYDEPTMPHGTHVTGTILGSEEDGTNQIGVAPEAQWIAARAFTAQGASLSALLEAGQFMLEKKPDIINNSWGQNPGVDSFYERVIESWNAAGIISVFAAGNANAVTPQEPGSINNPANYLNVLAIGATDINDELGDFSLLGPTPYDPEHIKPDLSAPGVNIRSAVVGGGYEDGWNGTSMATPHIAGVLALMKQVRNGEPNTYYEEILRRTAIPRTDERFRESPNMGYGYGLVDAYAAVHSVIPGSTGTITGRVLVPADGNGQTVINHEQSLTRSFTTVSQELEVQVTDPVSLLSVQAVVTQGETVRAYPMTDIGGDARSGIYSVVIPSADLAEGQMNYHFEALGFDGETTKSQTYTLDLLFGLQPGELEESFEADPFGWQWNTDWTRGTPNKGPMGAVSGESVMAIGLEGIYSPSAFSMLVTPPMDLREAHDPYLQFEHWYSTPEVRDYDYARVRISNDNGATWQLTEKTWRGDGSFWQTAGISLADYAGSQTPVYVSFEFLTDFSDAGDGWFIDDVALKVADGEAASDITGFAASEVTINDITLSWDAVTDPTLDHYHLERLDPWDGTYQTLARLTEPVYTDYDIQSNRTYEYRISAVNFGGQSSPQPSLLSVDSLQAEETFKVRFNSYWNTYFTAGGINSSWDYGEAEWDPANAYAPAQPFNAALVWGTNLTGDYRKRSDSFIRNETPFSIPAQGSARLNFTHWYEIEEDSDTEYGVAEISTDGGQTWIDVTGPIQGSKKYWSAHEVSLDEYRGENNVLLRFRLVSNDLFQYRGWYLSGVTVYSLAEEAVPAGEPVADEPDAGEPHAGEPDAGEGTNVSPQQAAGPDPEDGTTSGEPSAEDAEPGSESAEGRDLAAEDPVTLGLLRIGTADEVPAEQTEGPAEARITVLETGRYANSSGRTGEYRLFHKSAQQLTLRAEAYGYESRDLQFALDPEEVQIADFHLEPKARNTVAGYLADATDKSPIAGATVRLREDARIGEVVTDETGRFELPEVYVGSYTLAVTHPDYREGELTVHVLTGQAPEQYLELERFAGFETVLGHDDGSGENFILLGPGAGNVVIFDPEEYVKVRGIDFFAGGTDWPVPGGTVTSVAILRLDDAGKPLGYVGEPKVVDIRRGAWNTIDLSEYDFGTGGSFGLAVVQDRESDLSPSMALDTGGSEFVPSGRSYVYSSGALQRLDALGIVGNYMIRARVEKSLADITLDNLERTHYTADRTISVQGSVRADCTVNLYLDGHLAASADTADQTFSTSLELPGDRHELTVTAVADQKETAPGEPYTLIVDDKAPDLTVSLPWDQTGQTDRYLETTGKVFDEHFDHLTIQDEPVAVTATGAFRQERILSVGTNVLSYKAYDKAGNMTEVIRTVVVRPPSDFTVISPLTDRQVTAGETVDIAASTTRGTLEFQVNLSAEPDETQWQTMAQAGAEFKGQWTVPALGLGSYHVHFRQTESDRQTLHLAPGRLTVVNAAHTVRLAGHTRYTTAIEIARTFGSAPVVYLVNGETFADSAVAGPLARQKNAPLLLTPAAAVPDAVLEALRELGTKRVIIVGGDMAVSAGAETDLTEAGLTVERIAGANRYETSLLAAQAMAGDGRFFLASGVNLADAIAAGSYGIPILLSNGKTVDSAILDHLSGAGEVILLGGDQALAPEVERSIQAQSVTRLAGATRFDTNKAILDRLAGDPERLAAANGMTLADALTAAPLGIPVLLTRSTVLPRAAADYLTASHADHLVILGGEASISAELEQEIQSLLFN